MLITKSIDRISSQTLLFIDVVKELEEENLETNIIIPAYDNKSKGLIVELNIKAKRSNFLSVTAHGNTARALEKNFKRIITIMSSLNQSWEILKHYNYQLECKNDHFKVSDARSSSLALSISLLDIYRQINKSYPVTNITGTGILRIDGSFEETYLEHKKSIGVSNTKNNQKFLTSKVCRNLFDLEDILNQF